LNTHKEERKGQSESETESSDERIWAIYVCVINNKKMIENCPNIKVLTWNKKKGSLKKNKAKYNSRPKHR
jgi:hypothetical protein